MRYSRSPQKQDLRASQVASITQPKQLPPLNAAGAKPAANTQQFGLVSAVRRARKIVFVIAVCEVIENVADDRLVLVELCIGRHAGTAEKDRNCWSRHCDLRSRPYECTARLARGRRNFSGLDLLSSAMFYPRWVSMSRIHRECAIT